MEMLNSVQSGDILRSEQAITNFKQFIKRNLVDIHYITDYISVLCSSYAVKELAILSFSTLCHLIKRISIQQPSALETVYDPIIPFLLQRLAENKSSIRVTALKSLKTCIETSVNGDIDLLIHHFVVDGLIVGDVSPQTQLSVLDLLYQIIESSANFKFSFKYILENVVKMLTSDNDEILFKSNQILILYFTQVNPTNNTAKLDLITALITNNISTKRSRILLNSIDNNLFNKYVLYKESQAQEFSYTGNDRVMLSQHASSMQLETLLNKIPNWNIDTSLISPVEISEKELNDEVLFNEFTVQFDGKETEKNWKNRQVLIVKLRQILRGKNFLKDIENFISFLKSIKEFICKGLLSLRTTLSNNSCQLCKELAIFIGPYLDYTFVEYIITVLLRLTSARKIMQHQNSNVAIIGLLLYTNLNPKIFSLLLSTSQDKNIQPRIYTGNWIQLMLLKYYDPNNLENFYYIVESIEVIIIKGLNDPIPLVKDAMRNSFWTLCELDHSYESKIIKQLDYSIVRALERSKAAYVSSQIKRTPTRELIHEKIREVSKSPSENRKVYDTILTNQRSESLDSSLYFKDRKQPEEVQLPHQSHQKPTIRHHTADSDTLLKNSQILNTKTDEYDDFTGRIKRENIIYEEITSDSKQLQLEGFNKLLKDKNLSLPVKFHSALNNLTILNPEIFEIIFIAGNESDFSKISNYISTENTLRLFCLYLIKNHDFDRINLIINELSIEDLCLSMISILNFAIDASKLDNINLSIQYIKYRFEIIRSILEIFKRLVETKKSSIKGYLLASIFDCLNSSFSLIESDADLRKNYLRVFQLCLKEYNELFLRSLNDIKDTSIKNELLSVLGVKDFATDIDDEEICRENLDDSRLLSPIKVNQEEIDENVDEMTKVVPRLNKSDIENRNPNPFISDMTMIIPKPKGNGIFDFDKIELRNEDEISEISIGIDAIIEDVEKGVDSEEEEQKAEILEENTDISMIDKDKGEVVEIAKEKNEEGEQNQCNDEGKEAREDVNANTVQLASVINDSVGNNTGVDEKEEAEEAEAKDEDEMEDIEEVEDKGDKVDDEEEVEEGEDVRIMSDSTPDLNMLTIEENSKEGGYIGIVIAEIRNFRGSSVRKLEDINLHAMERIDDFKIILENTDVINLKELYDILTTENIAKGKFVVESFSILQYLELITCENNMITIMNDSLSEEADEIFLVLYEIFQDFKIKSILNITKIGHKKKRLQEIIVRCIYEKLALRTVDGEDIFMIESLMKKYINNETDSFIRMSAYKIYKAMFEIHNEGVIDASGLELVDSIIIESMNAKVLDYCER